MKIQKLTNGLIAALVLASPIAGAEDYPAANFEPKVIYSDSDYKHSSSSASTSKSSAKKAETSKPDANYPAANFEPKVLYSDSDYKYNASKSSSSVASSSSDSSASESTSEEAAEKSEDSMTTLFGLIALAVVGFVFFKQKVSSCPKKAAKVAPRRAAVSTNVGSGDTGVARYLSKNMPELSSVAKYLQSKEKNPASGVSKYVAKKVVAAKAAAAAKTTGVEKYLRNKG